ncbi:MAG: retropepsin-like aspartic protease [Candidatus Velthaea sp.]
MPFALRAPAGPLAVALLLLAAAPRTAHPPLAIAVAAGHPSRLHLRATASVRRDNRTIEESLDVAGTHRLVRRCTAGLCVGTWFDGAHLSEFGINQTPFPEASSEEPLLRTYAAIASAEFAESDFNGSVQQVSPEAGLERFRVSVPDGTPLIAVADARTHHLVRVEHSDGTTLITFLATLTGSAILYTDRHYESVTRVEEPLREPGGPQTTVSGDSDVPIVSQALPIVPCRLDGFKANCLIDTGTTPSGITLAFAERLNREPHGELEMNALGSYVTGVIDAGQIVVGTATLHSLHLAVVPQTRGLNFDVILGSDALAGMRIALEPARAVVHVSPSSATVNGTAVPLTFERGLPYVDARLGSAAAAHRLLLDTGDNGMLSIPFDAYRNELQLFKPRRNVTAFGLGGSAEAVAGDLPSASIGGLTLERLEIRAVRGQPQGHVGYALAAHCGRLAIDFGQRRIDCLKT